MTQGKEPSTVEQFLGFKAIDARKEQNIIKQNEAELREKEEMK